MSSYVGVFDKKRQIHLLRRAMFGAAPDDVNALTGLSAAQAVDLIIDKAATAPAPPINYYENISSDSSSVPYGQTWVNATPGTGSTRTYRRYSLRAWWLENIVNQSMTIEEKMVLFFSNYFPIEFDNGGGHAPWKYRYVELLRTHCLGNLKTFIRELSTDGAMLYYLNGRKNTKTAPDENYGRELQELFTVGKDGATYLEADVIAAAKVLTGWRTDTSTWTTYFDSTKHHISIKHFSSYYNNTQVLGKFGALGATELDDLVNMIFTEGAQDIAKFFARKVYRFFIHYDIDATIETTIIDGLAQTLINSNWEIKPMIKQLFKSDHFFDLANADCMIKNPIDYYAGILRTLGTKVPSSYSHEDRYRFYLKIDSYQNLNGMRLGSPPSVSGWPAYYQVPFFHQIWINTDTMPKRLSRIDYFLRSAGIYVRSGLYLKNDIVAFVENLEINLAVNVSDPNVLISEFVDYFLAIGLTASSRHYYKSILLSGQISDYYWTNAWVDFKANNTVSARNLVETRLRTMLVDLLHQAEYQLS